VRGFHTLAAEDEGSCDAALRLAPVDGGRITNVKGLDRDSIRLHRLRSLGAARGEELFDEANTASRNR